MNPDILIKSPSKKNVSIVIWVLVIIAIILTVALGIFLYVTRATVPNEIIITEQTIEETTAKSDTPAITGDDRERLIKLMSGTPTQ